jgi:hypothetical protein
MPRGDKSSYTDKQKRKAEHIEEGYEKHGVSHEEAERRAWATVNKESGGGKKSGSGRGKRESHVSSRKGGRLGGPPASRGAFGPPAKPPARGSVARPRSAQRNAPTPRWWCGPCAAAAPARTAWRRARDAAARSRAPAVRPRHIARAVDGIALVEENRVRHRRPVVAARVPCSLHPVGLIGAGRPAPPTPVETGQRYCSRPLTMTVMRWLDLLMATKMSAFAGFANGTAASRPAQASPKRKRRIPPPRQVPAPHLWRTCPNRRRLLKAAPACGFPRTACFAKFAA